MANGSDLPDEALRAARMIRSGQGQTEAIARGNGIWESRGIGNSYLVTTAEGDVLVNAGTLADAHRGKDLFARVSANQVHSIILTQSHANQYGGLEVYKTKQNRIFAHRLYPAERAYNDALFPHYSRGSRRIFGGMTGNTAQLLPTRNITPDVLVGDEGQTFTLGGRRFEIHWTPGGETRSAVIVWLPDERVALVGNLFGPLFGNHPNLNTLRGDKPRSAVEFIASVKKLRALAPEQILTGHEDIRGADLIQATTTRIIDAVQWVYDRTIEGMNAGKDPRTLMREIKVPADLALTEEYGTVAWNVRAIYHEYTGWFDPSRGITELYDVPAAAVAPALAELCGSAKKIAHRAREFVQSGKALEAIHLLDIAGSAEPNLPLVKEVRREALVLLDQQTGGTNLWERRMIATELDGLTD